MDAWTAAVTLYEQLKHLPPDECFRQIAERLAADGFNDKEIAYAIDDL